MSGIVTSLSAVISSAIAAFNAMMQVVLALSLSFGLVASGPATDDPIVFNDSENVKMSAVFFADTHVRLTAFSPYWFDCGLADIANSEEEFDAFVIAGDLTEMGDRESYEVMWESIENTQGYDKVLLATGNHDIRLDYEGNTGYIMDKQSEYIGQTVDKAYYSYDVNGYTFIVMGSDTWELEKANISKDQLEFLDSELERATADGKPAFVICHQPFTDTHGLPEVWKNGDLGEDSDEVKAMLTKYKNVFYISGHLHDGVYEESLEVFSEENGVYGVNLPAFGKDNDYGEHNQIGLGTYIEVYDGEVIFTARDFLAGKSLEGYSKSFELV